MYIHNSNYTIYYRYINKQVGISNVMYVMWSITFCFVFKTSFNMKLSSFSTDSTVYIKRIELIK